MSGRSKTQVEVIGESVIKMLQSTPPVKVLPVTTRGAISGYPHTFLVRLGVAPGLSIQYLDSCTSNEQLNAEREAALGSLRSLLHHCDRDAGWSAVAWSEFDGWPDGVPQQLDSSSCLLLSWLNATRLALGAEAGHLPEVLSLRGEAAQRLLLKIIRGVESRRR